MNAFDQEVLQQALLDSNSDWSRDSDGTLKLPKNYDYGLDTTSLVHSGEQLDNVTKNEVTVFKAEPLSAQYSSWSAVQSWNGQSHETSNCSSSDDNMTAFEKESIKFAQEFEKAFEGRDFEWEPSESGLGSSPVLEAEVAGGEDPGTEL